MNFDLLVPSRKSWGVAQSDNPIQTVLPLSLLKHRVHSSVQVEAAPKITTIMRQTPKESQSNNAAEEQPLDPSPSSTHTENNYLEPTTPAVATSPHRRHISGISMLSESGNRRTHSVGSSKNGTRTSSISITLEPSGPDHNTPLYLSTTFDFLTPKEQDASLTHVKQSVARCGLAGFSWKKAYEYICATTKHPLPTEYTVLAANDFAYDLEKNLFTFPNQSHLKPVLDSLKTLFINMQRWRDPLYLHYVRLEGMTVYRFHRQVYDNYSADVLQFRKKVAGLDKEETTKEEREKIQQVETKLKAECERVYDFEDEIGKFRFDDELDQAAAAEKREWTNEAIRQEAARLNSAEPQPRSQSRHLEEEPRLKSIFRVKSKPKLQTQDMAAWSGALAPPSAPLPRPVTPIRALFSSRSHSPLKSFSKAPESETNAEGNSSWNKFGLSRSRHISSASSASSMSRASKSSQGTSASPIDDVRMPFRGMNMDERGFLTPRTSD